MKILSNFKDYYDYLQGVYGIDELIVYDRICETTNDKITDKNWSKIGNFKPNFNGKSFYSLSICGLQYSICYFEDRFYYDEEIIKLRDDRKITHRDIYDNLHFYNSTTFNKRTKVWVRHNSLDNDKYNSPIIMYHNNLIYRNIKIDYFNFNKLINPEKMYSDIYDFLIKEKDIIDNRTDIEKLQNAGFDKKISFRNIK